MVVTTAHWSQVAPPPRNPRSESSGSEGDGNILFLCLFLTSEELGSGLDPLKTLTLSPEKRTPVDPEALLRSVLLEQGSRLALNDVMLVLLVGGVSLLDVSR